MRASHLLSNVGALGSLGAQAAAQIREQAATPIAEIERSIRTAWLPLQLDIELTDAIEAAVGRERMRDLAREAIAVSAEGPLLGPFVRALHAVGLSPHAAFRVAPKAWKGVYRYCGELEVERTGEREVTITQREAPAEILESDSYAHGIAAAFEGVVLIAGGREPRASMERVAVHRRIRYSCGWR